MKQVIAMQIHTIALRLFTWITATLLIIAPTATPHASAANVSPTGTNAPAVQQSMWVTDGLVSSTVVSGNTVYIGGAFNVVGRPTGGFGAVSQITSQQSAPTPNVDGTVYAMATDGMGGWYIGGTFTHVGGLERNNLAHIFADGTTDPMWNPNAIGVNPILYRVVWGLIVSHGVVYIGGAFTSIAGQPRHYLAAVDAVTGALTAQDIQTNREVWSLATDGSTIYVGGLFTTIANTSRNHLAALDAATAAVTPWDPDSSGAAVAALAVENNIVYVTGDFSHIGGQDRTHIAAVDASTGIATSWNPNIYNAYVGPIFGLVATDSTVYIGGEFEGIGGKSRRNIAAIDINTGIATDWNPGANDQVTALAVSGNTVYTSGEFTTIGGQARYHIAAIDATTGLATDWNPCVGWESYKTTTYPPPNLPGIMFTNGTDVYVGGQFTTIGGVERNNLAAIDATTGMPTAWNANVDGAVENLLLHNAMLYVAGDFSHISTSTRNSLAAIDVATGSVTSWDPHVDGRVTRLAATDTTLYIGGFFSSVDSQSRTNLAALDLHDATVTDWQPNPNGYIKTLIASNSVVFAGGKFTMIGGQVRNSLAALDAATGNATNWDAQPILESYGAIESMALRDKMLYVGGEFTNIGGQPRKDLAALDVTTGGAASWNPVANSDSISIIEKIAIRGNVLYVGGAAIKIGDRPSSQIVALDTGSGIPLSWGVPISGKIINNTGPYVFDFDVSGLTVYIGGQWREVGTEVRSSFAALRAVTPIARTAAATNVLTASATLHGSAETYGLPATLAFAYTTASGDYSQAVTVSATTEAVSSTTSLDLRADLTNLAPGTTYYYRAVATGDDATTTGDEQSFTTPALPQPPATVPSIVTQPTDVTLGPGARVTLTVAASGTGPFSYQWYAGQSGDTRTPIAGATTNSFTPPASSATAAYWVRVSNASGSVDSSTATVRVVAAPTQRFVLYLPTVRTS